jgi:hypothetical protein
MSLAPEDLKLKCWPKHWTPMDMLETMLLNCQRHSWVMCQLGMQHRNKSMEGRNGKGD